MYCGWSRSSGAGRDGKIASTLLEMIEKRMYSFKRAPSISLSFSQKSVGVFLTVP